MFQKLSGSGSRFPAWLSLLTQLNATELYSTCWYTSAIGHLQVHVYTHKEYGSMTQTYIHLHNIYTSTQRLLLI